MIDALVITAIIVFAALICWFAIPAYVRWVERTRRKL